MTHDLTATCACVTEHRPPVLEYQQHHVWPLGMGGPDTPDNRVWLCPTAHANVHELLRAFMRDGPLTWGEVLAATERPVSRYAYALARRGYDAWRAAHPG